MDFRELGVEEIATGVGDRKWSAREMADAALDRITEVDGQVGAFVLVDPERARAEAARVDEEIARGRAGPLAGVPLAVKDVTDVTGWVTTHGSVAHRGDPPAPSDSVVVARLRAAGAVVVGKTNTPEHGWAAHTTNPLFGTTRNPWDLGRSPGGSSGGSAAALAAGMVPLATGSDGGGSIRIPSAACGLSGFKPTLGRIPNAGEVPAGWGVLSTSGPMAPRIRDVATALDAVVGPHPLDPHSWPVSDGPWRRQLDAPRPPTRVGWAADFGYAPVDPVVADVCRAAVDRLADSGVEVEEVKGPFTADPVDPWMVLTYSYLLRLLLPCRGTPDWEAITPGLRQAVEWTEANVDGTDVILALDAIHETHVALARALEDVDVLLSPTCAGLPPEADGDGSGFIDGVADLNWVRFTYPYNLTRSPAGTVCAGFADGLPVGLQVGAMPGDDAVVLRALAVLEDLLAIDDRAPIA